MLSCSQAQNGARHGAWTHTPSREVAGENHALWGSMPQPTVPLEMAEMGSESEEGHGCQERFYLQLDR